MFFAVFLAYLAKSLCLKILLRFLTISVNLSFFFKYIDTNSSFEAFSIVAANEPVFKHFEIKLTEGKRFLSKLDKYLNNDSSSSHKKNKIEHKNSDYNKSISRPPSKHEYIDGSHDMTWDDHSANIAGRCPRNDVPQTRLRREPFCWSRRRLRSDHR